MQIVPKYRKKIVNKIIVKKILIFKEMAKGTLIINFKFCIFFFNYIVYGFLCPQYIPNFKLVYLI